MKILLDEQVPQPVLTPLNQMLPHHQIDHVQTVGWKSKKDVQLLNDLAKRGYEVLVTADLNQLYKPEECRLIKKNGFHHVRFEQSGLGIAQTASAIATVVAGLPVVLPILQKATGQRLVLLKTVKCNGDAHEICDPDIDPPPYWPGRESARGHTPTQRQRASSSDVPPTVS
ncbi:hypothetical protein [Catellatospora sp. NPDC049609]|uniref:PIN-like domain-containing protein n=1 Tax=Catellatospora sp. NPDC049609 TaxID=3155505 RepID=UPI00342DC30B